MANRTTIVPRREMLVTRAGQASDRYIRFFEDLSDVTNSTKSQIDINTENIAINAGDIAINAADIATNVTNIATNAADIATNQANIATNTADIATNVSNIAINAADIAINTADIATNTADIATNAADIAAISTTLPNIVITAIGYNPVGNEVVICITNSFTVTLEPDPADKAQVTVKATEQDILVQGNGHSIDDGINYEITQNYRSITCVFSATANQWFII